VRAALLLCRSPRSAHWIQRRDSSMVRLNLLSFFFIGRWQRRCFEFERAEVEMTAVLFSVAIFNVFGVGDALLLLLNRAHRG